MRLLPFVVAEHYQLAYLLAERSPQERDDLRAGAVIARRKGCLAHARGHAVHVAPRHRFIRPFGHIGERQVEHPRAREALTLRLSAAVDHGRSLRAGADAVCAEGRLRQTGDDASARRPADRLGIIRALVHVRERHEVIHHGGTRHTPEECHDLSAGARLVRCKEAIADAAGNTVLRRPLDGLVVIGVVRHVVEEVENAVVLHESHLDLDLAAGHGEGVFPIALVGEFQIVAVLVSNGNGFQHIAAVRRYRDGHGAALGSSLRTNCHGPVFGLVRDGDRITGRAAAGKMPLGDHRFGLGDLMVAVCVGEIPAARRTVPVFDVAVGARGGRFGRDVLERILMLVGILILEHRQGQTCRVHILAFIGPRVFALMLAVLKCFQNRAVGEFLGRLFDSTDMAICRCAFQIIAVPNLTTPVAKESTRCCGSTGTYYDSCIVAVKEHNEATTSCDTADCAITTDGPNVVAIIDEHIIIVGSDDAARIIAAADLTGVIAAGDPAAGVIHIGSIADDTAGMPRWSRYCA